MNGQPAAAEFLRVAERPESFRLGLVHQGAQRAVAAARNPVGQHVGFDGIDFLLDELQHLVAQRRMWSGMDRLSIDIPLLPDSLEPGRALLDERPGAFRRIRRRHGQVLGHLRFAQRGRVIGAHMAVHEALGSAIVVGGDVSASRRT